MDSKPLDLKLSLSMGSNHDNLERSGPSAPKKMKSLTLFEDLLDNSDTERLHSGGNLEEHGDKNSSPSDHQTRVHAVHEKESWHSIGFNRISDDDMVYQSIKKKLVSSLNSGGFDAQIKTIYKNGHSSTMGRAKLQSFNVHSTAVKEKCGGNANMNYAWYGASENEINGIISYGFSLPLNNGIYGYGFYLSAVHYRQESLRSSTADADGLRHMLLCRVILGKVEVVNSGSRQHNPSAEEFDSAVDNLVHPKMFIIWNAKINTHVLPEFIVSFRASPNCSGRQRIPQTRMLPNSNWIPFATLINGLSNFLPANTIEMLAKYLDDFQKQKITRQAMIQRLRIAAGDRLLSTMISSFGEKAKASRSRMPSTSQSRRS